eukprot:GHVU01110895.1.p2 GENE.GHVU01110895.1~~GHVU01110895.1.p2  ORF type:complete len:106 (+),score=4.35 GHVU01110895.1:445-762(+)
MTARTVRFVPVFTSLLETRWSERYLCIASAPLLLFHAVGRCSHSAFLPGQPLGLYLKKAKSGKASLLSPEEDGWVGIPGATVLASESVCMLSWCIDAPSPSTALD